MRTLKPSDLKGVHPWSSVDQKSEYESHMRWAVTKLAENGNEWREIGYDEYEKLGGGDLNAIKRFNKYLKSADTIVLYSPAYQEVADKLTD